MRHAFAGSLGIGLVCVLLGGLACAEEPAPAAPGARPTWAADLDLLRREVEPLKQAERLTTLLAQAPDAASLLAELARPHPWQADVRKGMTQWTREVPGVGPLTVFVYAPTGYTPEKAWPAMLWLHGGVSRDGDGGGMAGLGFLREECEAKGVLLVSPSATKDCVWWSPKGAAHAIGALRELARLYRVDPTRTAVAGFSDGGSAGFHLLAHAPDLLGCVISLMGNPLVTRAAGGPSFHANIASLPVFAFNGGTDQLYPSARMKPLIDEMIAAGASIAWTDLPEAGHNPADIGARWDEIWPFWAQHPRVALPTRIDWESAAPSVDGRRAWVEIVEIDEATPGDPELVSRTLPVELTPRPRLGVTIDNAHEGAGLKVGGVEPGTPAAEAGLKAGDVVLAAGETTLGEGREAFGAFRAYLETLKDKDGDFRVQRGEQTLTLRMRPRALKQDEPPADLGYGRASGRVVAEVKAPDLIEVRTRGVKRLRLHLARPLVDTQREVTIVLNGKQAWKGRVVPEAGYVLAEALRGLPGDPLYEGAVPLTVGGGS